MLPGRVDAGAVRAHLVELVGSGLLLACVADEAGVPRSTARRLWSGAGSTSAETADRLLAVRPLAIEAHLPRRVRLADAAPAAGRPAAVAGPPVREAMSGADLRAASARETAALVGVSVRTVVRWRARQREQQLHGVAG